MNVCSVAQKAAVGEFEGDNREVWIGLAKDGTLDRTSDGVDFPKSELLPLVAKLIELYAPDADWPLEHQHAVEVSK